jgi:zinc transporter 1/2/3
MEDLGDANNLTLKHEEVKDQSLTSYLLILALSIHACFEGIAVGLQNSASEIFYMILAICLHKWVEALSIGINLNRSKIDRNKHFRFITLFSLMTPFGIIFGMLFSGLSRVLEAVFLSISAGNCDNHLGSFIYISASEVVIEEFSVSKYKYEKFVGFLVGASVICTLTLFETHNH